MLSGFWYGLLCFVICFGGLMLLFLGGVGVAFIFKNLLVNNLKK